jgi:hypothetical protein
MIRKPGTSAAIFLILMTINGCSQAPAVDVMGSLFPAWLLCIALGAVFSIVTHWILTRRVVSPPFPISYLSLSRGRLCLHDMARFLLI